MRVLHVIPSVDVRSGGPITALIGLATAQARAGLDVAILSTYRAERGMPSTTALESAGVKVHRVGPTRGKFERHPQLGATVARLIADADVVHVHGVWEQLQHDAAKAAQKAGKPYVVTPHGMLTPWSLQQSKWAKKLILAWRVRRNLQRAAAIHFTTRQEQNETTDLHLKPPPLLETLGLDLSEFDPPPPRGSFRAGYPQIGSRPLIVFLGRIHPGKGVEHLVPALAQVNVPQAMLAVVGPDSENFKATVERLVAANGLVDRVIFTGLLRGADRVAALADADIFCLPSDHENFGLAVTESLAAGTPVIISDRVAIHDEITAAGVGEVTPIDVAALAAALNAWLSDADRRQAASGRTAEFARSRYDWNAIARRWVEHYAHLIQPPPPSRPIIA